MTIWMNLENIMLSEGSQTHKRLLKTPLYEMFKTVKFIETENGLVVTIRWEKK